MHEILISQCAIMGSGPAWVILFSPSKEKQEKGLLNLQRRVEVYIKCMLCKHIIC